HQIDDADGSIMSQKIIIIRNQQLTPSFYSSFSIRAH
ncbi:MAG: hypothetical protein ACI8RD_007043, partial [Bacillariaceae sp.]